MRLLVRAVDVVRVNSGGEIARARERVAMIRYSGLLFNISEPHKHSTAIFLLGSCNHAIAITIKLPG
jgi:hypothetical protein